MIDGIWRHGHFFVYLGLLPELITATSIFFVLGMESRQMKQETGGNSAIVAVDVHQDCRLASLYCERLRPFDG